MLICEEGKEDMPRFTIDLSKEIDTKLTDIAQKSGNINHLFQKNRIDYINSVQTEITERQQPRRFICSIEGGCWLITIEYN